VLYIVGIFALHLAAEVGDKNLCRKFLNLGAHIEQPSLVYHWTPLMCAAAAGQVEIVDFFLKKKADIEAKNQENMTSLHLAVFACRESMVEFLLDRGADKKAICVVDGYTQCTVMHLAAYTGFTSFLSCIIGWVYVFYVRL
jgi:ankyrin repeat protein